MTVINEPLNPLINLRNLNITIIENLKEKFIMINEYYSLIILN